MSLIRSWLLRGMLWLSGNICESMMTKMNWKQILVEVARIILAMLAGGTGAAVMG